MNASRLLLAAVVSAGVAAAATVWLSQHASKSELAPMPAPSATPAAAEPRESSAPSKAPETIAASGKILGVGIGSRLEEARETLGPLSEPEAGDGEGEEEKEEGERVYWKLKETEYSWILAWADEHGEITRMRAMLRPGKSIPFAEIGDLGTAAGVDATSVRWNLRRADGHNYRLIAQGREQQATTVYMFALD